MNERWPLCSWSSQLEFRHYHSSSSSSVVTSISLSDCRITYIAVVLFLLHHVKIVCQEERGGRAFWLMAITEEKHPLEITKLNPALQGRRLMIVSEVFSSLFTITFATPFPIAWFCCLFPLPLGRRPWMLRHLMNSYLKKPANCKPSHWKERLPL